MHCASDVCISLFQGFINFIVCIFRCVKNYGPGGWGPLNPRGPFTLHNLLLRHCAQLITGLCERDRTSCKIWYCRLCRHVSSTHCCSHLYDNRFMVDLLLNMLNMYCDVLVCLEHWGDMTEEWRVSDIALFTVPGRLMPSLQAKYKDLKMLIKCMCSVHPPAWFVMQQIRVCEKC